MYSIANRTKEKEKEKENEKNKHEKSCKENKKEMR